MYASQCDSGNHRFFPLSVKAMALLNDQKLAFRVPADLLDALQARAVREQRSVSQVARMSLVSALAGDLTDTRISDGGDASRFEKGDPYE